MAGFGVFRGIYDAGIYASLFEVIEPRLRATVIGLAIAVAYLVGALAPAWNLKGSLGLSFSFSLLAVVYAAGGTAALLAAKFSFSEIIEKRIRKAPHEHKHLPNIVGRWRSSLAFLRCQRSRNHPRQS